MLRNFLVTCKENPSDKTKMTNIHLTFLTILAFSIMQALCKGPGTAIIEVHNDYFKPNYLEIPDGSFVKWGIFFMPKF